MNDMQRDLYQIHSRLGKIEGTLEAIKEAIDANNDNHGGIDTRLRKVENRQHWHSGASAFLGMLGGYFTHLFMK